MNKILTNFTALLSAAVMTVCSCGAASALAIDDNADSSTKVSFNISGNLNIDDYEPSSKTDPDDFAEFSTSGRSFVIPDGTFTKEGYTFSGWSFDGIVGYLPGDRAYLPEDEDEVVLSAMWTKDEDELLKVKYDLVYKGEPIEKPFAFKDKYGRPGKVYTPLFSKIELDHAFSKGYTCDDLIEGQTVVIPSDSRIIMPDHEITLKPIFLEMVTFTYYAGDVDRVNGNPSYTFPRNEGSTAELADSTRLSRNGFALTGWLSDYDGKVYEPEQTVDVPDVDVVFTAVWTPINYNIVFNPGNKAPTIKVRGLTDTSIVCPDPETAVEGKKFAGWKDSSGRMYAVGSEYFIEGVMPGLGISLSGVWIDKDADMPIYANIFGDANNDGELSVADAAAIMQYLGNKEQFPLSGQGAANADCFNTGDGITTKDATAVQRYLSGMIARLPAKN